MILTKSQMITPDTPDKSMIQANIGHCDVMEVINCFRESCSHNFVFTIIEHPDETNARMSVTLVSVVSLAFMSDRIGKAKSTRFSLISLIISW